MHFLFPLLAFAALLATMPSAILANHFAVQNSTSAKYCLILEANITGTLEYQNTFLNKTTTVQFTVPEDGFGSVELNPDGSVCADKEEKLQVDFVPDGLQPEVSPLETQEKWSILLKFEKEGTGSDEHFKLANYSLTVHYYPSMNSTYTNDTIPYVYPMQDKFEPEWAANAATHNGFVCTQNDLPLNLSKATIQFNKLKVVAFVDQDHPEFNPNQAFEQCSKDLRTSDLVPIIVGAFLAGMVIIVLVAYLIGRARAKRQGYASV